MRRAGIQRCPIDLPGGDTLGAAYERQLAAGVSSRVARRSRGIYYTPAAVVDFIIERTLGPLLVERATRDILRLRILDPACGCGAFLLGAYRWLCRRLAQSAGKLPTKAQRRAIARCLVGIDVDPAAVKRAREAVAKEADLSAAELTDNIRVGDALLNHDEWFVGRFDAVVMNPPYVNIRRLTRWRDRTLVDAYRRRYRCSSGAFDLYVLFLERSIAALAIGGRLGAIVPNKLATLDYARQCRELLLKEGTLEEVVDVSHLDLFADAGVYPYILQWAKQPPAAEHALRVVRPNSLDVEARPTYVLQSRQQSSRGLLLADDLDVELRVPTVPLSDLCTIHSGATGFQAGELAKRLRNADDGSKVARSKRTPTIDFIVSGSIDRYAIRLGDVRFMGRLFARPVIAASDSILTDRKRRLYASRKIVLSGMSRRLEAALDARGLALGVQVYALTDWMVDPLYLLGLLNSSLLSHLFRLRFAAKRLAGGYYSLSKRQLGQLPIRTLDLNNHGQQQTHDRIVELVRRRMKAADARNAKTASLDAQIDESVLRLYDVGSHELEQLPAA